MGEISTQIIFKLNGREYGLDIMEVQSVEQNVNVAPVLGAPSYISGAMSLRGELLPVYSIAAKFGMPRTPITNDSKLLIVNLGDIYAALEVDSVVGIVNVDEDDMAERPGMFSQENTSFVGHVAEVQGRIMLLIDLDYLVTEEEIEAMVEMTTKANEDY